MTSVLVIYMLYFWLDRQLEKDRERKGEIDRERRGGGAEGEINTQTHAFACGVDILKFFIITPTSRNLQKGKDQHQHNKR